ncbi:FimD/PapC C-terminal domain-containing protein, partial [Enterobacter sp.]|uniref:FimD/PapC C-terminal domain-containing protein n=1 Tax=Enterobacter sp. TaxID=42895 RepID=UPI003A91C3F6
PFGAVATSEDQTLSGIVDDTGTLYLAGLRGDTRLSVQWGDKPDQRCVAMLSLDELKQPANKAGIRLLTVPCQPETVREP